MDQETRKEFKKLNDKFDKKFEKIDKKFEKIDKKFEKIDKKFDKQDSKFDTLAAAIQKLGVEFEDFRHNQKFQTEQLDILIKRTYSKDEIDSRLENHEGRISALEHTVKEI